MALSDQTISLLQHGTVSAIGAAYRAGVMSIEDTVQFYITRIHALNQTGPELNAVKSISPTALDDARRLDGILKSGDDLGPLHGIPVLIKANVMMGDAFTVHAGVAALKDFRPKTIADIVVRLKAAGAVILGQTNMTEFADYVADTMPAGFSGAEGFVKNPHGIPYARGQGSSVGSASAVAAGMAPLAVGGETQNSIQTPASHSSVVGFKPSVGAICGAGIIPLVPSQDAPGFLGRCVEDVRIAAETVSGLNSSDSPFPDHISLQSVRIGVPRMAMADRDQFAYIMPQFEAALEKLSRAGATIIDPCDLPSAEQLQDVKSCVFATEFKASLNAFLEEHNAPFGIASLAELIEWNASNLEAIPYGQSLLINAQSMTGLEHPTYIADRAQDLVLSQSAGIDAALSLGGVDVLIAPMGAAAKCTGKAGAPTLAIPVGLDTEAIPFGITLYTKRGDDQTLVIVGALVEQAIGDRKIPIL